MSARASRFALAAARVRPDRRRGRLLGRHVVGVPRTDADADRRVRPGRSGRRAGRRCSHSARSRRSTTTAGSCGRALPVVRQAPAGPALQRVDRDRDDGDPRRHRAQLHDHRRVLPCGRHGVRRVDHLGDRAVLPERRAAQRRRTHRPGRATACASTRRGRASEYDAVATRAVRDGAAQRRRAIRALRPDERAARLRPAEGRHVSRDLPARLSAAAAAAAADPAASVRDRSLRVDRLGLGDGDDRQRIDGDDEPRVPPEPGLGPVAVHRARSIRRTSPSSAPDGGGDVHYTAKHAGTAYAFDTLGPIGSCTPAFPLGAGNTTWSFAPIGSGFRGV